MGYLFMTSRCFGCGRLFSYNPNLVPSIRIRGRREPICQRCVDYANPKRKENGLEPIVPLPGAYESVSEDEMEWDQ